LILPSAARTFARRTLPTVFFTAARAVAAYFTARVAFLFAPRTGRRLLLICLFAVRTLLLALLTLLHIRLRIRRALTLLFIAGARLALRVCLLAALRLRLFALFARQLLRGTCVR
jgi:hypothetical protein